MKYVAGFCFDTECDNVALVLKNRPKWQKGKWNAIGGKIEENETPAKAMSREFLEETGVLIPEEDWVCKVILQGNAYNDFEVFFFSVKTQKVFDVETTTDEEIKVWYIDKGRNLQGFNVDDIQDENFAYKVIPNLLWLIPLVASEGLKWPILIQDA